MSVVNLVILLESAACALVHEVWEVGAAEAQALDAGGVQVMGMGAGAIVPVVEDLQDVAAYHLAVVAATADLLHIVMPVVIHLMLMEIKAGRRSEAIVEGL